MDLHTAVVCRESNDPLYTSAGQTSEPATSSSTATRPRTPVSARSACRRAVRFACAISLFFLEPGFGATDTSQIEAHEADNPGTASAETTEQVDPELSDEVPDETVEGERRQLGSNEDPMASDEARREVERAEDVEEVESRQSGLDLYGSGRIRYRTQDELSEWQDGGSRLGANAELRLFEESFAYARYEVGFNVLTGLESLTNPGEKAGEQFNESVFTRLLYAGIDTPGTNYVVGKNWSTYYKVSYFTDRFMGTGGSASGTYNAQTDGGPTGPGRADNTVQTHFRIDFLPKQLFQPFELNAQLQHGNEIPFGNGADYGTAYSLSAVLTTRRNHTIGVAHNHAQVDIAANPSLRTIGLKGNANASLFGVRSFGDRWYTGFVVSRLRNHETTDDGIYFNGWGSEFYAEYRVQGPVWIVGGYNFLEPDKDETLARNYRIRYGIAGLRYSFDDFRRMIFVNLRLDDSFNADGTPGSDVITLGVRWDFSRRVRQHGR